MALDNFGIYKCIEVEGKEVILSRSAQPNDRGFKSLKKLGIQCIFKLNEDWQFSDDKEEELADPMVVYQYHLPRVYDENIIYKVIHIAGLIQVEINKGNNVHIHDHGGHHHNAIVCETWRIINYNDLTIEKINNNRMGYDIDVIVPSVDTPDKLIIYKVMELKKEGKL